MYPRLCRLLTPALAVLAVSAVAALLSPAPAAHAQGLVIVEYVDPSGTPRQDEVFVEPGPAGGTPIGSATISTVFNSALEGSTQVVVTPVVDPLLLIKQTQKNESGKDWSSYSMSLPSGSGIGFVKYRTEQPDGTLVPWTTGGIFSNAIFSDPTGESIAFPLLDGSSITYGLFRTLTFTGDGVTPVLRDGESFIFQYAALFPEAARDANGKLVSYGISITPAAAVPEPAASVCALFFAGGVAACAVTARRRRRG